MDEKNKKKENTINKTNTLTAPQGQLSQIIFRFRFFMFLLNPIYSF